jgi:hypothetical protein
MIRFREFIKESLAGAITLRKIKLEPVKLIGRLKNIKEKKSCK